MVKLSDLHFNDLRLKPYNTNKQKKKTPTWTAVSTYVDMYSYEN